MEVALLHFVHAMFAPSELIEFSLALAVLSRNRNATPLFRLIGSQKMPDIELDMPTSELEQHNLDCYETIRIAEQAETVWVEIEVESPRMASFFEESEVIEGVAERAPLIQESMEEYTQAVANLQEFLTSVLDSVYTFTIHENTVQMTRPFEEYEEGKRWAEEMEDRISGLPSQVTLKVYDDAFSEQELESQREPVHDFEVS